MAECAGVGGRGWLGGLGWRMAECAGVGVEDGWVCWGGGWLSVLGWGCRMAECAGVGVDYGWVCWGGEVEDG